MRFKHTIIPLCVASLGVPSAAWSQPSLDWETTISFTTALEGADEMAVDQEGNSIVVGYLGIEQDFYVFKLDPSGTLLWSRIIGGSGLDHADNLVLDDTGDIYLVGRTLSADFPTHLAYQDFKNGPSDAFIMKLAGTNGDTLFSTFFGGDRAEWGRGIDLGTDGSIYITGATDSLDLPTVDPIQENLTLTQCFCDDAFVTRFTPQADSILFSTYLGGALDDTAHDIKVDANGNVYFAGRTRSEDWPTLGAIQPAMGGGEYDLFVAKITADSTLSYSTYLGGEDWDLLAAMDIDAAGSVFVSGSTRSISFPTTPGAFREQFVGGISACEVPFGQDLNCYDWFVTKVESDGGALAFSTFIGGHKEDEPRNMVVDQAGRAHVIGYTFSDDFPLSTPFGTVVTMRLNADGSDLEFLVSHETPGPNGGSALALRDGDLFIAASVGLPYDTYVAKFSQPGNCPADVSADGTVDVGDLVALIGSWGPCQGPCAADVNGDRSVDVGDLVALIDNWGPCP